METTSQSVTNSAAELLKQGAGNGPSSENIINLLRLLIPPSPAKVLS